MVQVQHQQQLARRQHTPQIGVSQPRRLSAADIEAAGDVPGSQSVTALIGTSSDAFGSAAPTPLIWKPREMNLRPEARS